MKKSIKFLAMALCLALVVSLCAVMFAANTETSAADYKDGEWVTKGTTFKFDGKDYTVNKDQNFSGEYITVDGTNYYLLSDVDDIKSLGGTFGEEAFIIANDIDLGAWTQDVAAYASIIEGCGHTITFGEGSTRGLLQSFAGIAKNIVLDGSINVSQHAGAFVGSFLDGELHGIINNANITDATTETYYKVGGIIGYADLSFGNFLVQNCVNNGDISGNYRVSGIVGNLQTSPWNDTNATGVFNAIKCKNTGDITSASQLSGGIISVCEFYGTGETNLIGCSNSGNITAPSYSGGIVSLHYTTGKVEGCVNTGKVYSSGKIAGGILADVKCGENGEMTISNCANLGDVSSSAGNNVGGIIGQTKTARLNLVNCLSTGALTPGSAAEDGKTGTAYGIVFRQDSSQVLQEISNCYYSGADVGMNLGEGEQDMTIKLTDEQVANNYVVEKLNTANEADGNKIRWTVADGKPAIDMNTLIETTTEATTTAATTTAKVDETTAATTTAKADNTTAAKTTAATTAEEKEGGCGGSLTVASVMILTTAVTGSALVVRRKRK